MLEEHRYETRLAVSDEADSLSMLFLYTVTAFHNKRLKEVTLAMM